MNVRKLGVKDFFILMRAVGKIGIKEEIKEVVVRNQNSTNKDGALDLLSTICEKVVSEKGENAVIEAVAKMIDAKPKEISELDLIEFMDLLMEMADPEEWKGFFTRFAKWMK